MIQTAIATETYYAPLVFDWTVFAGFFILGPLTIFQRTRPAAAIGFLIAACVLAFLLWFATALQVYAYWGLGAVVLASLGFLVPGTVIAAVIGTLLYGTAFELLGLGIITVVTLAAIAVAIVLNKDRLASYA